MEQSRRDFLKTAALRSAGTFMLLNAGFWQNASGTGRGAQYIIQLAPL